MLFSKPVLALLILNTFPLYAAPVTSPESPTTAGTSLIEVNAAERELESRLGSILPVGDLNRVEDLLPRSPLPGLLNTVVRTVQRFAVNRMVKKVQKEGHKINPKDVVHIWKMKKKPPGVTGSHGWVENGTKKAGLEHIMHEHGHEWDQKGWKRHEIPHIIQKATDQGKIVGNQGRSRPIYEVEHGGSTHHLAISMGKNGFVVGMNPSSEEKARKSLEKARKSMDEGHGHSHPGGYPEPGTHVVYDDSQKIDLDTVPLQGGILVKTLELSVDPYMRGRLRDKSVKSYLPAFELGEPISGYGIGLVLRSEHPEVKKGDHIYGIIPHQHYAVLSHVNTKEMNSVSVVENPHKLPWSTFIGVLGMPGKTAYMGWKAYAKAQKEEKVFVTSAAGPVGSLVVQLAKLDGLKVIASAGSPDKVKYVQSLGADVVFNYKEQDTAEVLRKEGPINIFWDGVGGKTLDAALVNAVPLHARFIECGMISEYNGQHFPIENIIKVLERMITMQGFLVFHLEGEYNAEFYKTIPPLVASGQIKHTEDITDGLERVPDIILAVQKGQNKAKAVVHVAND